jgi:serine/threonine protein kinase
MALEFMEAGSLARLLCKQMTGTSRLYSDREALLLLLDVSQALAAMHSAMPPLIHRDLKMASVSMKWLGSRGGGDGH